MMERYKQRLTYFIAIFALLAVLSCLFNSYYSSDLDMTFKGYELAFGKKLANITLGSLTYNIADLKLNIFALLSYVLPLVSFILLGILRKNSIFITLILLASGILFIIVPNTAVMEISLPIIGTTSKEITLTRSDGNYIGMLGAFLGMCNSLYLFLMIKFKIIKRKS